MRMLDFIFNLAGGTRADRFFSYVLWLFLAIALVGSILAAFGICSGGCSDAEKYSLFGLHFSTVGIPFFIIAIAASFFRNNGNGGFRFIFDVQLAGAVGAEILFIYIQKHIIGHYCPTCMVIAATVILAAAVRLGEVLSRIGQDPAPSWKRVMRVGRYAIVMICIGFSSLTFAIAGISAPADHVAAISTIRQDVWLAGPQSSTVEVYFVTDWFCDYCRKIEPTIEAMLPEVGKVARYTFIDDPVHLESLNFVPFHTSLLLNDKPHYLAGRKILLGLAATTKRPTEEQVRSAFTKAGLTLRMADYADITGLTNSTTAFLRANGVTMTPAVVIRNRVTGERRTLSGIENIGAGIVLTTIKRLQSK
ncbi:vitamin K epoxide reductase family protein [Geobacter sp. FeAm09]|uniref:vitamin K epoxide reductase family protein n=1 Tax=Geobacter sp. FeAm09 TaxID=2597769 RepID=UPI00143DBFD0|nr:vitamin K epoxide reductase family protein [Geobacter sp. FeAm09]